MTDQEKAQRLLDKAARVMTLTEADFLRRVVNGETHNIVGDWKTKEDRRFFEWCLTNFAEYLA